MKVEQDEKCMPLSSCQSSWEPLWTLSMPAGIWTLTLASWSLVQLYGRTAHIMPDRQRLRNYLCNKDPTAPILFLGDKHNSIFASTFFVPSSALRWNLCNILCMVTRPFTPLWTCQGICNRDLCCCVSPLSVTPKSSGIIKKAVAMPWLHHNSD